MCTTLRSIELYCQSIRDNTEDYLDDLKSKDNLHYCLWGDSFSLTLDTIIHVRISGRSLMYSFSNKHPHVQLDHLHDHSQWDWLLNYSRNITCANLNLHSTMFLLEICPRAIVVITIIHVYVILKRLIKASLYLFCYI